MHIQFAHLTLPIRASFPKEACHVRNRRSTRLALAQEARNRPTSKMVWGMVLLAILSVGLGGLGLGAASVSLWHAERLQEQAARRDAANSLQYAASLRQCEKPDWPSIDKDRTMVEPATNEPVNTSPWTPAPSASGDSVGAKSSRFTIERLHAKGGLGQVNLAIDGHLNRAVALKEIRPDRRSEDARRRFVIEAEITGQLEHPGIVPIYALEKDAAGEPYYAMRFIQGRPMSEAIQAYHREPTVMVFRDLLQRFISVCKTIAYAHSKGVIHRDLKPANVMLGDYGETLVVDWGLAKRIGTNDAAFSREPLASADSTGCEASDALPETQLIPSDATQPGQALGTPAYMAPEQARGDWNVVGPAADIFSLGAVLYELLTGQAPLQGRDVLEVIENAKAGHFTAPRKVKRDVPRALEAICGKTMAAKPEERFTSAKELAADVEHWLADEPVTAYAEPWNNRAQRWRRKHPVIVASVAAGVLVGVAALVGGTVLVAHHAGQLEEAYHAEADAKIDAQEKFALARSSVDDLMTVLGDELTVTADIPAVRKKVLRKALVLYQQFLKEKGRDAAVRERTAAAYRRVGHIHHDLREIRSAETAYRQAAKLFEELVVDYPGVATYHSHFGGALHNLANIMAEQGTRAEAHRLYEQAVTEQRIAVEAEPLNAGYRDFLANHYLSLGSLLGELEQLTAAESAFRLALEIKEKLAADSITVPKYRRDLAGVYNNLGTLMARQDRRAAADQAYRRALEIQTRLAADFPSVPQYRRDLAKSQNNLGMQLQAVGQRAAAEECYRPALEIQEKLATEFPSVPLYRLEFAGTYINFSNLLRDQGLLEDSLAIYAKAVGLLEPLVQAQPLLIQERVYLRNAHGGRAAALDILGRHAEAIKDWDRALALNPVPAFESVIRGGRAQSLISSGKHGVALAEVSALAAAKGVTTATLYDLAHLCAVSSAAAKDYPKLQDQYAARAVELLRLAVSKGYKDIEHLKKDDDLKALREREDYKKLIRELETPNGVKPPTKDSPP